MGRVYTSSEMFRHPVPLRKGQFVTYGIVWNGERSVLSLRVVEVQRGVATLEVRALTRRKETALTFKVKGLAEAIRSGDFDRIRIVETLYRDEHGLTRTTGTREVMWSSGRFTRLENLFNQSCTDSVRSETLEVRAGVFRGVTSCISINSLPGFVSYMTVWKHPAVPLNGLVQWQGRDGRLNAQLLDFEAMR